MSEVQPKGYVQLSLVFLGEILKAFNGHPAARRFNVMDDPIPDDATISGAVTDGNTVRIYFNNCERREYTPQLKAVLDPEPGTEQDPADVDAVVHSTGESNVVECTGHNPEDLTGKQQRRKRR